MKSMLTDDITGLLDPTDLDELIKQHHNQANKFLIDNKSAE